MSGDDPGDVCAVCSGGGDNREQVAVVEDVDGEVEQAGGRERRVLWLVAVCGQHGFVAEVAVLVGIDGGLPGVTVVEQDTVEDRAGVLEVPGGSLELSDRFETFFTLESFGGVGLGMGLVPFGELGGQGVGHHPLFSIPLLAAFSFQSCNQFVGVEVEGSLPAEVEVPAGVLPVVWDLECAAGQSGDALSRGGADRAGVDISAAGAVDQIDHLDVSVGGLLQAGRTRVDSGVEDRHDHTASVELRVRFEQSSGSGFDLR